MATVRGSRTIRLSKKGDTLTSMLISDKPLLAKYQEGKVVGSWVQDNRTVYAQVLTSFTSTPLSTSQLNNVVWKFNGVVIAASDTRFKQTTYTIGSILVPALVVKADIMDKIDTSTSIEFTANAYTGGFTTPIGAMISVTKEHVSANTYSAYILDANGRGATITTQYPTVTLKGILEKGGVELTSGVTYQWHKSVLDESSDLLNDPNKDAKMLLPGKTQQTITLTAADIDTYDTYVCEFFEGGKSIKTAMISVRDETDTKELMYNVTGNEDNLDEGQSVIYKPKVVLRGTTTAAGGNWTYKYQKVKADGTLVGAAATGASYTVTYASIVAENLNELVVLFEAAEA